MTVDGKEFAIPCGYQQWRHGSAPLLGARLGQFNEKSVAATFAWPEENTCLIKLCACESPFEISYKLKFDGKEVTLDSDANVSFGPSKGPQLVGRAE